MTERGDRDSASHRARFVREGAAVSRLRRSLGVLISAGAALSAVLLAPASASAAGNILVVSAGQTADPYVLQLDVNDSNGQQLTSMTVHLYAGATDVYDITDMAYTSGVAT